MPICGKYTGLNWKTDRGEEMTIRNNGREHNSLRKVNIIKDYMKYAEGSCLIELGNTKVICTATMEEKVPPFLKDTGSGWITAEYSMLPRSSEVRIQRESSRGKIGGRTHEIQRLIGRSLRATVDLMSLKEKTLWIDCDVIQADGGTRTASITGGFVALALALKRLKRDGVNDKVAIHDFVAATSVGILNGEPILDLTFEEDSNAEVDMNIVMMSGGKFIEVQGTAEKSPFAMDDLKKLLALAEKGINELLAIQREVIGKW